VTADPSLPCVEAVLAGLPRRHPAEPFLGLLGREWDTAMFKSPVVGPVGVGAGGLEGDRQADTERHGGLERALLVHPVDHYRWWRNEGLDGVGPGAFGENLAVVGQEETGVCVGDLFRIGTVVVRVTQPRQPGWKLARRWRAIGLPKRMAAARRTGWYLAVVEPGALEAGDGLELLDRPSPGWTIERCLDVLYDRDRHRHLARDLFECPWLGAAWRAKLVVRHPALRP